MGRPKAVTDPDAIAYAVKAVIEDHRSYREVAAELVGLGYQVSHATVKRWCDAARQDHTPTPPARAGGKTDAPAPAAPSSEGLAALSEPADAGSSPAGRRGGVNPELAARIAARQEAAAKGAPPADPDAPFDLDAELPRMIRAAQREAEELLRASNPRAAQTSQKRASDLLKTLAIAKKNEPKEADLLTFSKQEIENAMAELETLLAQLCERPVLCSACSRELSIKFGRGQG